MCNGAAATKFEVLSLPLSGRTGKKHEKPHKHIHVLDRTPDVIYSLSERFRKEKSLCHFQQYSHIQLSFCIHLCRHTYTAIQAPNFRNITLTLFLNR